MIRILTEPNPEQTTADIRAEIHPLRFAWGFNREHPRVYLRNCPNCDSWLPGATARGTAFISGLEEGRLFFCSQECKETWRAKQELDDPEPEIGEMIGEGFALAHGDNGQDG